MSEQFTKGPWFVADASRRGGYPLVCTINAANCIVSDCDAEKIGSYDAALIACAPEMYALLNEISDGLLDAGGYGNCALSKRIESLLAKARGES